MFLYSWGANTYGQLGLGRACEEIRNLSLVNVDLCLDDVRTIEVGANQSFLITNGGAIFGCGLNNVGQLGFLKSEEHKFTKLEVSKKHQIKQLSCKWDSCYAVTVENICIAWGGNTFGQLGLHPSQLKNTQEPIIICNSVKEVAAGLRHCAILLNNGKVMTAGDNKKGQLGRLYYEKNFGFDFVNDLKDIQTIACGQNFTLALTQNRKLYGWGCNKFGQLGLDPLKCQFTGKPILIDLAPFVENIYSETIIIKCGWTHCLLLAGQELLAWGRNNYGQLGTIDVTGPYVYQISKLFPEEGVKSIAVGAEHNLAITGEGNMKAWGWNEHGSCGVSNACPAIFEPATIKSLISERAIIGAGSGHSFCLIR